MPSVIVADMFGRLDDDPLLRRAREMEHDRAQADAEIAARTQQPRAWESPASIQLDVLSRFPSLARTSEPPRQTKSEHVNVGGNLLVRDPMTGEWQVEFSPPNMASEKRDDLRYRDLLRRRNTLIGKQFRSAEDDAALAELEAQIIATESPAATEPSPLPASRTRGFIGAPASFDATGFPAGANRFESPFERGLEMGGRESRRRLRFNPATGELE